MRSSTLAAAAALLACGTAHASDLPVLYVTDSGNDTVQRLEDLDGDGDYNEAGEVVVFYDSALGTVDLSNNLGIVVDASGVVYVCDSSTDVVGAFEDLDDDGECNDPGENRVFFDGNPGGNASGIVMTSAQNMRVVGARFWIASSNASTGVDQLIYLEDLNADGDANDAGEAVSYFEVPGASTGDSIPQDVEVGLDGAVYYLEAGSTGLYAKGVYRLVDLDMNGTIDPLTEVAPFFIPPPQASNAFFWGFSQAADGAWYMADTTNELIWRFRDDDMSGDIDPMTEASIWWQPGVATLIWQVDAAPDGSLYCAESQAPDRVLRMRDLDSNGAIDPVNEVFELWDDTRSPTDISNPRGLVVVPRLDPGVAYCFGDGSGAPCPCGNEASAPTGCLNGTGVGARLEAFGAAEVGADSLVLQATGAVPGQPGLFFQGVNATSGGPGAPFGDGLRCAGGSVARLEVTSADGSGTATSSVSISVEGNVAPGDLRRYQYWYRDPAGSPCGATFNLTSGYELVWS